MQETTTANSTSVISVEQLLENTAKQLTARICDASGSLGLLLQFETLSTFNNNDTLVNVLTIQKRISKTGNGHQFVQLLEQDAAEFFNTAMLHYVKNCDPAISMGTCYNNNRYTVGIIRLFNAYRIAKHFNEAIVDCNWVDFDLKLLSRFETLGQ